MGVAQLLVAVPILTLSLSVLLNSELGHALSPYWAGSLVSHLVVVVIVSLVVNFVMAPRSHCNDDITKLRPKHKPVMCCL